MAFPTKEQFKKYGMTDLSQLTEEMIEQLESDEFQILVYTEDETLEYLNLDITAVPKRQVVKQEQDLLLEVPIQYFTLASTVQNNSILRVAVSTDQGATWKTYKDDKFVNLNIDNMDEFLEKGMTPEILNNIPQGEWRTFLKNLNVRFAYYLDLADINDVLKVESLTYTTIPIVDRTPALKSINIKYKDLTVEGRLKNLELVNQINLAKLNFKSNALLLSSKYSLNNMVIDTCDTKEMNEKIYSEDAITVTRYNVDLETEIEGLTLGRVALSSISDFTEMEVETNEI